MQCAIDLSLQSVRRFSTGGKKLIGDLTSDCENGYVPHLPGKSKAGTATGAWRAGGRWLEIAASAVLDQEQTGCAALADLLDLLPKESMIGVPSASEL